MVEGYSAINQKLQQSLSEQSNLDKTIQELKVYRFSSLFCVLNFGFIEFVFMHLFLRLT